MAACCPPPRSTRERGSEAWTLRLLGDLAARSLPSRGSGRLYYAQALALAEVGMRHSSGSAATTVARHAVRPGGGKLQATAVSTAIQEMYRTMEMTSGCPR